MRSDALLFVGILIFIGFVWFAMGGSAHPLSLSSFFASAKEASTTPPMLSDAGTTTPTNADVADDFTHAQEGVVAIEQNYLASREPGTPSVYQGLVTIRHSVAAFMASDPRNEYITISVSSRAPDAGIDISGWQVKGMGGESFTIPDGVNLAHTGAVNSPQPVVLAPGQSAVIGVGDSPIGVSFRENKCTGYLDQFQAFNPPLAHACPVPAADFDTFGTADSACSAYLKTVAACTVPLAAPNDLGSECHAFIAQHLNYNGCIDAHQNDADFFGDEWRLYVGQENDFFTKDHDTIRLLDASGNTVDILSY